MAKNSIFIIEEDDVFIDESGKTSLEPEGVGHHHDHDWQIVVAETGNPGEAAFDSDGGFQRGARPVEGDGAGAPE